MLNVEKPNEVSLTATWSDGDTENPSEVKYEENSCEDDWSRGSGGNCRNRSYPDDMSMKCLGRIL